MNFPFSLDESNQLFKGFQVVLTIIVRIANIGPGSSRLPPWIQIYFQRV